MAFAEPDVWPDCRSRLDGATRCPTCGLDLTTEAAQNVLATLRAADGWLEHARVASRLPVTPPTPTSAASGPATDASRIASPSTSVPTGRPSAAAASPPGPCGSSAPRACGARAPFLAGAGVLALVVLANLEPYADAVPRWVVIATVGVLLLGVGVTWEDRVRDGRAVARRIATMR